MTSKILTQYLYESNKDGWFEVLAYYNAKKVLIRFVSTGFIRFTTANNITAGKVKDKFAPSVFGVGYIGEGEHLTRPNGKFALAYQSWSNMLRRCYDPSALRSDPSYEDCIVDVGWHNYQTFAVWFYSNHVEGYELDKDLLSNDSKIYSPETCVFILPELNKIMMKNESSSRLPVGVTSDRSGNFAARITTEAVCQWLGSFNTPEEASKAYQKAKADEIIRQAFLSTTPRILFEPLLRRTLRYV